MLFWLGSIDFETPRGRFILTADSAIRLPKRRRATKEEAAQIWPALEARLMYASYDELLPWYELYWELTSERLYGYGYGPGREPRVSNLLRTIELALWSEQLHLEVQEPYDPLPELDEWEPPPLENLRKYIPPQSPSEIWKRKSAIDTFIGICLKDQNGDPVVGSRVRVKLPDGKTQEGKTDSDGELQITGLTVDGKADITLLDFAKAGKALPIQPDPPKEFKIVLVDETGKNGVADVAMVFDDGATPKTVKTDSSGTATYETQSDSVSVNFESADALAKVMKPIWQSRPATPPSDYIEASDDVVALVSKPKAIETPEGEPFSSLSVDAGKSKTLSVRPAKKRAVVIEMHDTLFRNDSAVVNPEGEAPSKVSGEHESLTTVGLIATILRYNEEHDGKKLFVAGHTDRAGGEGDNVKLSNYRAKAVLSLIEGKKDEFVAACIAKHSEVDVTQLMDWANKAYNFTCKPTVMDRSPSDENYYRFRTSYNEWVKGPIDTANGEIGPRGTKISGTGRLNPPDLWDAMFDLYEHNLRQELGEDENGVKDLRKLIQWVSGTRKSHGFGEAYPIDPARRDGVRSQVDRRVEVLMFDPGEEPNLTGGNGDEIYTIGTYQKLPVPPYNPSVARSKYPFSI